MYVDYWYWGICFFGQFCNFVVFWYGVWVGLGLQILLFGYVEYVELFLWFEFCEIFVRCCFVEYFLEEFQ